MRKKPQNTSFNRSVKLLADSLQFLGFTDEWLSHQQLTDIALDGGFEEFDEALEPDCMLTLLEQLFSESKRIKVGRWEFVCCGKGADREYKFYRGKPKLRKGTVVIR